MFGVTNRRVIESASGLDKLGSRPNPKGPNELRLFSARPRGQGWSVDILPDTLTNAMKDELGAPRNQRQLASYYVARKIFEQARGEKRNVLFFVHGYNNDLEAVLRRARAFETDYNVIAVPFTWPANGGGLSGVASYKSDKRDARASADALDRSLAKAAGYLAAFTEQARAELREKVLEKHPDDREAQDALYAELLDRECPFRVSAVFHSMGNYLLKHMLKSSLAEGNSLLFDNIVLASADTNNQDHADWVSRLKFRRRLYVTINENDGALAASRAKIGDKQLARLGHYPFALDCREAVYVNFTNAAWVRRDHAYFGGEPVEKNEDVKAFFNKAFNGEVAEESLRYIPDNNYYEFRN
ncbi:MAG: hypothetical protein CMN28_06425 [Salinisphaeraceae bacterium]|nr:hypothetical protein [Salinisphaeraceae bacterium]